MQIGQIGRVGGVGLAPATGVGAAWVRRGASGAHAILDYDVVAGRYWYDGVLYATEAGLLTAIGGTAAGATRVIGPWLSPTELIGNIALTDTTGWTATNGSITAAAGVLELTGNGAGSAAASAYVAGLDWTAAYQLAGSVTRVSGGPGVYLGMASANGLAPFAKSDTQVASGTAACSVIFAALQATRYVGIRQGSTSTGKSRLTAPQMRLVRPLGRMTTSVMSGRIDFTAPATVSGTQVLFQVDANDETCRTRIVYDATGHLRMISTYNSIEQTNFDLGAVAAGASGYVDFLCEQGLTTVGLNGGARQQSYAGSAYGMAKMRLGCSYTGETWGGTYNRLTIYDGEDVAPASYIYGEGDSYMVGANDGTALWSSLQSSGRRVITTAVGATSLSQQLARIQAHQKLAANVFVHWDGDANGYGTTDHDLANIGSMISSVGHQRIIIIPSCRRANASSAQNTATTALQAAIVAAYPANTFDAQSYLATLSNGTTDAADVAAGTIPTSCLQGDGTHLTPTAMSAVAAQVSGMIGDRGWL